MCDPATALTVASFVIQAGSAAASHGAQAKAAREGEASARASGTAALRDIGTRKTEEKFASARQVLEATRDQSEIEGMINAAAGEAGVGGKSLRLLVRDSRGELGRLKNTTQKNLRITNAGLDRQADGVRAGVQNQINQNPGPSALATSLRIGGAAVDTAATLHSRRGSQ